MPLLVCTLPAIQQLEDLAYDLSSTNRSELPDTESHCKQYPEECR